jgi:DNA-binding transcriptional regulator YhcF (GntR family)
MTSTIPIVKVREKHEHDANLVSTMPDYRLNSDDPTPLHDQVAAAIRRAIADGEVRPGERLPPAKDLAAALGVNPNTALRGLRILRDEGLLEFRRGRGISVAGSPQRGAVVEHARELVRLARASGYSRDELLGIVKQAAS